MSDLKPGELFQTLSGCAGVLFHTYDHALLLFILLNRLSAKFDSERVDKASKIEI